MVGEPASLTRDQRTASVLGGSDGAEIVCLSRSNLQTLSQVKCRLFMTTYWTLHLIKSARRVHQMGKQIARLANGETSAPKRASDNALAACGNGSQVATQNPPPALSDLQALLG